MRQNMNSYHVSLAGYRVRGPVGTQRPCKDAFSIKKKLPQHKQEMKSRKQTHQKIKQLSPHNIWNIQLTANSLSCWNIKIFFFFFFLETHIGLSKS